MALEKTLNLYFHKIDIVNKAQTILGTFCNNPQELFTNRQGQKLIFAEGRNTKITFETNGIWNQMKENHGIYIGGSLLQIIGLSGQLYSESYLTPEDVTERQTRKVTRGLNQVDFGFERKITVRKGLSVETGLKISQNNPMDLPQMEYAMKIRLGDNFTRYMTTELGDKLFIDFFHLDAIERVKNRLLESAGIEISQHQKVSMIDVSKRREMRNVSAPYVLLSFR